MRVCCKAAALNASERAAIEVLCAWGDVVHGAPTRLCPAGSDPTPDFRIRLPAGCTRLVEVVEHVIEPERHWGRAVKNTLPRHEYSCLKYDWQLGIILHSGCVDVSRKTADVARLKPFRDNRIVPILRDAEKGDPTRMHVAANRRLHDLQDVPPLDDPQAFVSVWQEPTLSQGGVGSVEIQSFPVPGITQSGEMLIPAIKQQLAEKEKKNQNADWLLIACLDRTTAAAELTNLVRGGDPKYPGSRFAVKQRRSEIGPKFHTLRHEARLEELWVFTISPKSQNQYRVIRVPAEGEVQFREIPLQSVTRLHTECTRKHPSTTRPPNPREPIDPS